MKFVMICIFVVTSALTVSNAFGHDNILSIQPGETKILYNRLADPSIEHLGTIWNSFSRIDVTQQSNVRSDDDPNNDKILASILIDADADTPVYRWNGSTTDLQWLKKYMDFLPYEMSGQGKVNSTLVIGSGGGGDVLVALAGGSKNVTAVELNLLFQQLENLAEQPETYMIVMKSIHLSMMAEDSSALVIRNMI